MLEIAPSGGGVHCLTLKLLVSREKLLQILNNLKKDAEPLYTLLIKQQSFCLTSYRTVDTQPALQSKFTY